MASEQRMFNVKTFHKHGGVKWRRNYQDTDFRDAA